MRKKIPTGYPGKVIGSMTSNAIQSIEKRMENEIRENARPVYKTCRRFFPTSFYMAAANENQQPRI